jgi:hypothetical protein
MAKVKTAMTSFEASVGKDEDATAYVVQANDQLLVSHPVVKAHPELFTEMAMEETR